MRVIHCDVCGSVINNEYDVRYLGVSKMVEEENETTEKPVMRTQEICPACSDKIIKMIQEL